MITAFSPIAPTVSVACSASPNSVRFLTTGTSCVLRLVNLGTETVFVKFGDGSVLASATDMPVLPGAMTGISVGDMVTWVGVITAQGTSTLYVTPGHGLLVEAGAAIDFASAGSEPTSETDQQVLPVIPEQNWLVTQADISMRMLRTMEQLKWMIADAYNLGDPSYYQDDRSDELDMVQ